MNDLLCEKCGVKISFGEFNYSISQMKQALCQKHQKEFREEHYQPKLAHFLNNSLSTPTNI